MPRSALLEYFVSDDEVDVVFAAPGLDRPLSFGPLTCADGSKLTAQEMARRASRLIVDFHGLPSGWDQALAAELYDEVLALPPQVDPLKRTSAVLQRKLTNPRFAYGLDYWDDLSGALLPDGVREHIDDCDLLVVVPHGPLHSLPFAALRWSGGYLVERFGLCQVPSASVLANCRAHNRRRGGTPHSPDSCLVASVAAADDLDPEDFEADGDTLVALFQRDGTPGFVTQLVGPSGPSAASKAALLQASGGHDIVHVACHGLFGSGNPLDESGLLLSDGDHVPALRAIAALSPDERHPYVLTAREVLALRLRADLVTLRACSSGRVDVDSGDELVGLIRAFLYAGAPSLLVSLWNVHKRSSRALLDGFYRRWLHPEAPLPKWRALQLAQCELLREPAYAHPYHWAPFVLVGDWI